MDSVDRIEFMTRIFGSDGDFSGYHLDLGLKPHQPVSKEILFNHINRNGKIIFPLS